MRGAIHGISGCQAYAALLTGVASLYYWDQSLDPEIRKPRQSAAVVCTQLRQQPPPILTQLVSNGNWERMGLRQVDKPHQCAEQADDGSARLDPKMTGAKIPQKNQKSQFHLLMPTPEKKLKAKKGVKELEACPGPRCFYGAFDASSPPAIQFQFYQNGCLIRQSSKAYRLRRHSFDMLLYCN